MIQQRIPRPMAFELMVLDTAIDVIEKSFWRHFKIVEKILKLLIDDCMNHTSERSGRRIIAFKKTVIVLANRLELFEQVFHLGKFFASLTLSP